MAENKKSNSPKVVQKITCSLFCCLSKPKPMPKPKKRKEESPDREEKRRSKKSILMSHLPPLKLEGEEEDKATAKPEENMKSPLRTPGYTPMICSTQNIFSFKDKNYQKDQEKMMKALKQFVQPTEEQPMESESDVCQKEDNITNPGRIRAAHRKLSRNSKNSSRKGTNASPKKQNKLPKISKFLNPKEKDETVDLINKAEEYLDKLDQYFDQQTQEKSTIDRTRDRSRSKKSNKDKKKKHKRRSKRKSKRKGKKSILKNGNKDMEQNEESYSFNFWKNKMFPSHKDQHHYYEEEEEANQQNNLSDTKDPDHSQEVVDIHDLSASKL